MKSTFFSKKNIQSAVWALVIAFVCFIAGKFWGQVSGPEKVIVEKIESYPIDTSYTIIQIQGDSNLIDAVISKNQSNPKDEITYSKIAKNKLNKYQFKGFLQKDINSYANINLPRKTYSQNETIKVEVELFDKTNLDKISPLVISIMKREEDSFVQLYEEQFQLNSTKNTIRFSSGFKPGNYTMSIGFYFMDDLHEEYPPFYKRNMMITILK